MPLTATDLNLAIVPEQRPCRWRVISSYCSPRDLSVLNLILCAPFICYLYLFTELGLSMPHRASSWFSSIVDGVGWVAFGVVLQVGIRVGVLAIMARLVTPHDFGVFALALIFTSFAERLGQVGVGAAFIQRQQISPDDLVTATILSLISGVVIAVSLIAVAPLAARSFEQQALQGALSVLALGFIVDAVGMVPDAVLQRDLKFRQIVRIESLSFAAGLAIVGPLMGLLGYGVWALVAGNLAMRLIKAVLLVCASPFQFHAGRWSSVSAHKLLSTGIGFSLGKILNFLSLQGDNFVVGRLLGVEALGMYTRAYQAMTLPAIYVGQAFERVLFPALSQKQGERHKLKIGLLTTLEISALVAIPASVGMSILAEELVVALFGLRWREVVPVLEILACGVFFRAAYKCSDVLIRSLGCVYGYAARQGWYTAIIVGGSWLGAWWNGLIGVAYAVVLGVGVNYTLMTLLAARLVGVSLRELLLCHLPGMWVGVWIVVALGSVMPEIRSIFSHPFVILIIAASIGLCTAMIAWIVSLVIFRGSRSYQLLARLSHGWLNPRALR